MGTSTGYDMPTGGEWRPLKLSATNFVQNEGLGQITAKVLLKSYLIANGGFQTIVQERGGNSGNRVTKHRIGHSFKNTGSKLGSFLSGVVTNGLGFTLKKMGLAHLIGKTATEICTGLLETFTSSANTLDDHAVRTALDKILSNLLKTNSSFDDFEQSLNQTLDNNGIILIMADFFGYYLYELFCRDFYEIWQKKVGLDQAKESLLQVKKCIFEEVKYHFIDQNISSFNWNESTAISLVEKIMRDTLEIFEVI